MKEFKRFITFFVVVCCVFANAWTQKGEISLDLSGGFNLANRHFQSTNYTENFRFAPRFGHGVAYMISDRLSIEAGFLFNGQGSKITITLTDEMAMPIGQIAAYNKIRLLSAPVKLGYYVGNDLFGFARIGLQPSYVESFVFRSPAMTDLDPNVYYDFDQSIMVSTMDFSALFEFGVGYHLTSHWRIFGNTGFQWSVLPIDRHLQFANNIHLYATYLVLGLKYTL